MADNTYRYLNTLIQEGSFSRAAQTLEISQPSLS
ncbi:MAG: LysR family transcriptional regulator, partial [Burkholderiaceae bacterium]|nr:LysR family transcriptional regulator [Burkholderiaceae bacterium]